MEEKALIFEVRRSGLIYRPSWVSLGKLLNFLGPGFSHLL